MNRNEVVNRKFRDLYDLNVSECPPAEFKYRFLANEIEKLILAEKLPSYAPFPSERDLADTLNVSLGTGRRVIEELRERGLVITAKSKGTFVVPAKDRLKGPGK